MKKCSLAWRLCSDMAGFNHEEYPGELTDCLMYILSGLKHLDFRSDVVNQDRNQNWYIEAFKRIVDFASHHFEGSSMSFKGVDRVFASSSSSEGAAKLCFLLTHNPNLTLISFQDSSLISAEIMLIATAIGKSESITELSLMDCNLGDQSAVTLASALKNNSSLKALNLVGNAISQKGAMNLIKINNTITSLNLENNSIFDHTSLLAALKENPFLTSFNCGGWPTPEMSSECNQHLAHNSQTKNLYQNYRLLPWSEAAILPTEVLQLIFSIGTMAIKESC